MKEKQFDPAGINDESPAPGMASVNTHNPDEGQRSNDNANRQRQDKGGKTGESHEVDETHGAELNITEESTVPERSGESSGVSSVEPDVTPRNLEADSDGA